MKIHMNPSLIMKVARVWYMILHTQCRPDLHCYNLFRSSLLIKIRNHKVQSLRLLKKQKIQIFKEVKATQLFLMQITWVKSNRLFQITLHQNAFEFQDNLNHQAQVQAQADEMEIGKFNETRHCNKKTRWIYTHELELQLQIEAPSRQVFEQIILILE